MRLRSTWYGILPATLALACSASAPPQGSPEESVLEVNMAIELAPGIASVRYEVTPVSCDDGTPVGAAVAEGARFHDFELPPIEGLPSFDEGAEHQFTDALFTLPAGCYDVRATPLDESGAPSPLCAPATQRNVEVLPSATTEIVLISQCNGRDFGALDAVATLNHPPELESVAFEPSAFVACLEVQRLCATLIDADGDPLEFVWALSEGNPPSSPLFVAERSIEGDATTECVEVVPQADGEYGVELSAYDLALLNGESLRVEEILALQGDPLPSRFETSLAFQASGCDTTPPSSLTATLRYTSSWGGGYCADVDVSNTGSSAVPSWTVGLAFVDSALQSGWDAAFTSSGDTVEAHSLSYNGVLAPGASTTFGFCGRRTGASPSVSVTSAW